MCITIAMLCPVTSIFGGLMSMTVTLTPPPHAVPVVLTLLLDGSSSGLPAIPIVVAVAHFAAMFGREPQSHLDEACCVAFLWIKPLDDLSWHKAIGEVVGSPRSSQGPQSDSRHFVS